MDLFTSLLGPSETRTATSVNLAWGTVVEFPAKIGDVIEVCLPEDQGEGRVFYRTATTSGELTSRQWRLEAGEAPVLLEATLSPYAEAASTDETFDAYASSENSPTIRTIFRMAFAAGDLG